MPPPILCTLGLILFLMISAIAAKQGQQLKQQTSNLKKATTDASLLRSQSVLRPNTPRIQQYSYSPAVRPAFPPIMFQHAPQRMLFFQHRPLQQPVFHASSPLLRTSMFSSQFRFEPVYVQPELDPVPLVFNDASELDSVPSDHLSHFLDAPHHISNQDSFLDSDFFSSSSFYRKKKSRHHQLLHQSPSSYKDDYEYDYDPNGARAWLRLLGRSKSQASKQHAFEDNELEDDDDSEYLEDDSICHRGSCLESKQKPTHT